MFIYYNGNLSYKPRLFFFFFANQIPNIDSPPTSKSTHIMFKMLAFITCELLVPLL